MYVRGARRWFWQKKTPLVYQRTPGYKRLKYRISRLEGASSKEVKTHDVAFSFSPDNSGGIQFLTNIAQGDTSLTREGLVIKLLSIQCKGYCEANASQTGPVIVRMLLVKDRYNLGANPAVTDILESASVIAFKEHDEKRRFQILWDKAFPISVNDTSIERATTLKYYKKFKKPQRVDYRSTGSVVANAGSCNMFLLMISNVATNLPTLELNFRFKFTG